MYHVSKESGNFIKKEVIYSLHDIGMYVQLHSTIPTWIVVGRYLYLLNLLHMLEMGKMR